MTRTDKITIFDTTLRDGQQCPGAGMSFEKCVQYAHLAHELRIDVLEAGFPASGKVDFAMVKTIADELASAPTSPIIAGLCQLRSEQIDSTIEALSPAVPYKKARLHVYLPVDPNLMVASLGAERAENKKLLVEEVHDFIARAVKAGCEVEYSPEGYSRMGCNFDFVTDTIRAAIAGGAKVINCPDTAGCASRFQGKDYFVEHMDQHAAIMDKEFPNREIIWSMHCHNDFGLALDNSLNGVFYGPARQIEGCINGIGERAGNVALEQCVMVIKHFAKEVNPERPLHTGIVTEHIQKVSDFVSQNMLPRQPHWPISGGNAAKHSSGGHTNAILKNPLVYQAFDPKETGGEIALLFGPLSGGNHAKSIIERYGFVCTEKEKTVIGQFLKDLYSERRKGITDEELLKGYFEFRKPIKPTSFDYTRRREVSEVILQGKFFDEEGEVTGSSVGKDSALATLKSLVDSKFPGWQISHYQSQSGGEGISAESLSTILVANAAGEVHEGHGADQDIEISAMKAYIDAINTAYIHSNFKLKTA